MELEVGLLAFFKRWVTIEAVDIDVAIYVTCYEDWIASAEADHSLGREFLLVAVFDCADGVKHVFLLEVPESVKKYQSSRRPSLQTDAKTVDSLGLH